MKSPKKSQEQKLVDKIKRWTNSSQIGDDCALLAGGLLASMDTLVDGVHFLSGSISNVNLGWKAIAVNLSDIAAMAGRPRHLLVSITLPEAFSDRDLEDIYKGICQCAEAYRVRVVGGDLTRGEVLSISVTVLGDVHEDGVLRRSGARVGDLVVVTGDFGASRAGLFLQENRICQDNRFRKNNQSDWTGAYCLERHWRPRPRLCESWAVLKASRGEAAMMDASDGLADAIMQLGWASGVEIVLDEKNVPVHQETAQVARQAGVDPLDWALYGGEDYELVSIISNGAFEELDWKPVGNSFKVVGRVTRTVSGEQASLIKLADGQIVELDMRKSFQHFQ